MSSAGLVVIITVSLIGVLAIMGVLAFIYWHKHHHVNQRLIDEEDHSSFDRIGLGPPSSTVPLTDDYALMIPSRLTAALFPVCKSFPIEFLKLPAKVHINPVFKEEEKQWIDEFEVHKLNITLAIHHSEVPKDKLKSFVEQGVPLYKVHSMKPKLLLDEIKQIVQSKR